jgi:hypothetical protein
MITRRVGEIEVTVPENILEFDMVRAEGETDEEFEAAKELYRALFTGALGGNLYRDA